jgi:hypothetical protein
MLQPQFSSPPDSKLRGSGKDGHNFLLIKSGGKTYHRSAKVKEWLEENQKHIRMFFLPSYSPELNPDEFLNQDVESNAVGRKRAHSLREMIGHIRSFLWGRQRRPSIIQKHFEEKHVQYAAP